MSPRFPWFIVIFRSKFISLTPSKCEYLCNITVCFCQTCSRQLYNWLKVAPYQADQQMDYDDDDDDDYESGRSGLRVFGVAHPLDL